jgi:hypothetical protein
MSRINIQLKNPVKLSKWLEKYMQSPYDLSW